MSKRNAPPAATEDDWEDVPEEDEDDKDEEEEDTTINNSDVVMKYKKAAQFANAALQAVIQACVAGAKVCDLCQIGDDKINSEAAKLFRGVEKGVAFPTCVNVNAAVCYFSPSPAEDNTTTVNAGDVVRIDLGAHIDGYSSVVAHTIVVPAAAPVAGAAPEKLPPGRESDIIAAAQAALNVAVRSLRPGVTVYDITELIEKTASDFGVNVVEGVLSHQMKRYIIDGSRAIAGKNVPEHKVHNYEIAPASVWTIDVVYTTGKGKLKERETKTMVFKQSLECNYQPKLQAAREVMHDVNTRFQVFPFAVRALDPKKGRLGLSECIKHGLVVPYPVLYERDGDIVAQFKVTVLVTNTKIERITGVPSQPVDTTKTLVDPKLVEASKLSMTFVKKEKAPAATS